MKKILHSIKKLMLIKLLIYSVSSLAFGQQDNNKNVPSDDPSQIIYKPIASEFIEKKHEKKIKSTCLPPIVNATSVCDSGMIAINLVGDTNNTYNWYNLSSVFFQSGNNYNTPTLYQNDTFMVKSVCYIDTNYMVLPNQVSTFTGNTRGYWFVAPSNFVISGLRVPTDASTDSQNIQVVRLDSIPPVYSTTTNDFISLVYFNNVPGNDILSTNIFVKEGDIIGVLGTRGTTNSYAPYSSTIINDDTIPLKRLGFQGQLQSTQASNVWTEVEGSISRVEMYYSNYILSDSVYAYANVNKSTNDTLFKNECNGYTWSVNNITYTSSVFVSDTLIGVNGCDSIVNLDLTINYSDSSVIAVDTCNSYNWYGNTYTSSTIAKHYLSNIQGCDSIIILNLTIHKNDTINLNVSACESYTWMGNTYTDSTFVTQFFTNINGCDSIVNLDLKINKFHYAGKDTLALICRNYVNTVDLFPYLGSNYTPGGSWIDIDGLGTLNGSIVNTTFMIQDSIYRFIYVLDDNSPCINDSAVVALDLRMCGGVEEFNNSNVTIFPNPTNGKLNIISKNEKMNNIIIYDLMGKIQESISIENNSIEIDLNHLKDGTYFYKINKEKEFRTGTFILKK